MDVVLVWSRCEEALPCAVGRAGVGLSVFVSGWQSDPAVVREALVVRVLAEIDDDLGAVFGRDLVDRALTQLNVLRGLGVVGRHQPSLSNLRSVFGEA